jgi:hypothetical protein
MKPHYAKMLRSASRGGFTFSARKFLDAGSSNGGRHCHSIMEFDLSLAYGYSALNALMPFGFCTGFFLLKKEEEEEDASSATAATTPFLIKTDILRRH